MEFDFQTPIQFAGVTVFPDWSFLTQPRDSSQILETITIYGTNRDVTVGLGGQVDEPGS